MIITIDSFGDKTVGIFPCHIEIEYPIEIEYFEREEIRERFRKFWQEELDDDCTVRFGDECADCGNLLENNDCKNNNCVSNIYE